MKHVSDMKHRLTALMLIMAMVLTAVLAFNVPARAAEEDFVIEDGILKE